jgi:hypothetical protein
MAKPCFECGENADVEHHVVPRSRGGKNTVPLCESCHGKAHGSKMTTRALTIDALARKKARGERVGRHAQYGYTLTAKGTLIECPAEQATIAVIRRLAQDGQTPAAIARSLNTAGGTFRGRLWRTANVAKVLG